MPRMVISVDKVDEELAEIDEQIEALQTRATELRAFRDRLSSYEAGTASPRRRRRAARQPQRQQRRRQVRQPRQPRQTRQTRQTRARRTPTAGRKTNRTSKMVAAKLARPKKAAKRSNGKHLARNADEQQTIFATALMQNYQPGDTLTAREARERLPKNAVVSGFSNYFHRETKADNGILEKVGHGQFKIRDDANARLHANG